MTQLDADLHLERFGDTVRIEAIRLINTNGRPWTPTEQAHHRDELEWGVAGVEVTAVCDCARCRRHRGELLATVQGREGP